MNPRSRNQELRDLGLSWTPNSSRISRVSRGAVRNSVSNPCSVGLSASHRRLIFSWVSVSLGGRPGEERASRPCSPPCRCGDPTPDGTGVDVEGLGNLLGGGSVEDASDSEQAAMLQLRWGAFVSHARECNQPGAERTFFF